MTVRRVAALSDEHRGILWILLTMALYASTNALAKHLMLSYPVVQVVWARYAFQVLLVALLLRRSLPRVMVTRSTRLQLGRSLLLLCSTVLFFSAISVIPLAEASAIMFVAPLLVVALSVPMLGEHVGPRRWSGVAVGFVGALIIIRPGGGVMQAAALAPLGAACAYALYEVSTRVLSRTDSPLTILAYTALVGTMVSSAAVPFFWQTPDTAGWFFMVLLGAVSGSSHFCVIKAFAAAPAATVTPFGYTTLIWATIYGFVLFGDLPDGWTMLGAGIIVLSGLYIFRRERARRGQAGADRGARQGP